MKKSIHILVLALLTTSSIASASNIKTNALTQNLAHIFDQSADKQIKFVSYADPNLVASEITSLQKHSKTVEEIIADDTKIIESENTIAPKKVGEKKDSLALK